MAVYGLPREGGNGSRPISPRDHHPERGGVAVLLLQKGGPVVEMGPCSATDAKDTAFSQRTVPLRISIR